MPTRRPSEVATFDDVQVVRAHGPLIEYRIGARMVSIPALLVEGDSVRHPGEHGRLTIPTWLAFDHALARATRGLAGVG
jgi:hypothetical protein